MSNLPVVEELPAGVDAVSAFLRLRFQPHCIFLDSALGHATLGRYSFVAANPAAFLRLSVTDAAPLQRMAELIGQFEADPVAGLPPFQGGVMGLLSYDLSRSLEKVPAPRYDEFETPALALGVYDVVLAFDHQQNRGWLISQGWPEIDPRKRRARAEARLQSMKESLEHGASLRSREVREQARSIEELAPQYPMSRLRGLTSSFSRDQYLQSVRRAIDYIYAGDIFQVNLAQRLLYPATCDSADLYLRLRDRNPATFAGYFDVGTHQIISASPERFVSVRDRIVEARPIKGTRSRSARPEADLFAADDLQQSEKDRAENVMIVDLMRNDLSRVCDPDSVRVDQLCGLEAYQFVQHLVSVVQGRLSAQRKPIDLLRAAFPGGSITGAPKLRAMEIIAELEPTARGAYCGSLGYLGFDGTMDWSILIRTITAARGWWQIPVGGGIVAQSDPQHEYDETWQKALGMLKAIPKA